METLESQAGHLNIGAIVSETYRQIFNQELPTNIGIEVLPKEEYKQKCRERTGREPKNSGGTFYRSKDGNKYLASVSEAESVYETVLTLGHEIGHILGLTSGRGYKTNNFLGCILEETRAYSFQGLWANTIQKYNVGGLGDSITAENQKLLREPLEDGVSAMAHYFAASLVNLFDKKSPGRIYDYLNVSDRRGTISRLINELRIGSGSVTTNTY